MRTIGAIFPFRYRIVNVTNHCSVADQFRLQCHLVISIKKRMARLVCLMPAISSDTRIVFVHETFPNWLVALITTEFGKGVGVPTQEVGKVIVYNYIPIIVKRLRHHVQTKQHHAAKIYKPPTQIPLHVGIMLEL